MSSPSVSDWLLSELFCAVDDDYYIWMTHHLQSLGINCQAQLQMLDEINYDQFIEAQDDWVVDYAADEASKGRVKASLRLFKKKVKELRASPFLAPAPAPALSLVTSTAPSLPPSLLLLAEEVPGHIVGGPACAISANDDVASQSVHVAPEPCNTDEAIIDSILSDLSDSLKDFFLSKYRVDLVGMSLSNTDANIASLLTNMSQLVRVRELSLPGASEPLSWRDVLPAALKLGGAAGSEVGGEGGKEATPSCRCWQICQEG